MSHFRPTSSPYQLKFKTYLRQNLAYLHDEIQNAVPIPAEEVRTQAMHTLSYTLKVREAWLPTRDLLLALASSMEQAGHREDWIPYLTRALEGSIAAGDQSAAAEFHLQLALLYRLLSQFKTAHEHIVASIDQFASLGEARNQARALNELAWLEQLQHGYEDAGQHVEQALSFLDEDDPERGMSYRVQGMIAFYQKHLAEAEFYHLKALTLFQQQKNLRRIAWARQNLAAVLREQKKLEEAIAYFQEAAIILWDLQDIYHWATVQMNLGVVYLNSERASQGLPYFEHAEQISNKLNDTLQSAMVSTCFGLAFLALAEYTKAENAFLRAINLYGKLGDAAWRLNAVDGLAMVYLGEQQYSKARTILTDALNELPRINKLPNYNYLFLSINKHFQEAKNGLDLLDKSLQNA